MSVVRLIATALTVALTACGGGAASEPSAAEQLDPAAFAAATARPETVTVNVHVPDDGSLPGTDLAIPFDRLRARADELPDPATPLAVYCRTGRMSALAVEDLRDMGYRDVVELRGGMEAWGAAGRRLLPPQG